MGTSPRVRDPVGMTQDLPDGTAAQAPALPADLRLGTVDLTVSHLDRSVAFYQDALGLRLRRREDPVAVMGTEADDLVILTEDPAARPAGRHAGLYHFALLFADRMELSRVLRRLALTRTPIEGAADHGVSEAIYLPDPDGNGIELYADRSRDQWPAPNEPGMKVGMYTIALDLDELLAHTGRDDVPRHAADGLVLGHVHLHVGDVDEAVAFYRDVIGFEQMANLGSASFVAAGGYHHHLGLNVWRGRGVGPAPAHSAGIREWEILLPSADDVAAVRRRAEDAGVPVQDHEHGIVLRDPWEIPVAILSR
jgi:catechol 2,3-dioxygenase